MKRGHGILVLGLRLIASLCAVAALGTGTAAMGAGAGNDWPMWRYDAAHTAASPHALPAALHPAWAQGYGEREPVWDDPLNRDMMPYDAIFEPVVAEGRMFLAFNDRDKVVALDARSGEEQWSFYADGPVRFSPVVFEGKVYFTSDDGHLYCVSAAEGRLLWRFRGGPSAQKVLGNRRVISAWPARGGPVQRDGVIYFAASIWPFMGTFLYALDAQDGSVRWINDSTSADYIKQPHGAPAFAGVAPQGQLAATEELLLVPGGRSLPAALDRSTGRLRYFNFGAKGQGGSFVAADETRMFVHTRLRGTMALALSDGKEGKFSINEPVLADGMAYAANTPGEKDGQPAAPVVQAFGADKQVLWQIEADGRGDLIKAGKRLYAAGEGGITAIDLPDGERPASIAWSLAVQGRIRRLLAAGEMLYAVTQEGWILAFGAQQVPAQIRREEFPPPASSDAITTQAERLLRQTEAREGYALWLQADDERLLEEVVRLSDLHVTVVDADGQRVQRLRTHFDAAGLYGRRVAIQQGDPLAFLPPRYTASLMVVGASLAEPLADDASLATLYESLRPYGGKLWIPDQTGWGPAAERRVAAAKLAKAKVSRGEGATILTREGPLPGAGSWTHAYGDIANTVKSNDRRVRLPLGLLWFGGNSHDDVLPRHGHGPAPQVIGGRLFIEGMNCLSARDVYTGRVLWKREFEDLGTHNVYYDDTYVNEPLSVIYNQVHTPGANARGTNYVATPEGVYLAVGSRCLLLDAVTGRTVREFQLPKIGAQQPAWGFIGVYENLLLAGVGFANYSERLGYQYMPLPKRGIAWGPDYTASLGLMAFDRHTGRRLWKLDAAQSFIHNGIVAGGGRIYCLDRLPKRIEDHLSRRGQEPPPPRLLAVDPRSGRVVWQRTERVFGTWLGYAQRFDLLLEAGSLASDRSPDEVGKGMTALRGRDGRVLWEKPELAYSGPCILHNDVLITNVTSYKTSQGAYRLKDGAPATIPHPLTDEPVAWNFTRNYGCNTCIASEHLLTFRSGAAGFYDLESHSGTGNFGGFKSGCTSNLIVADGVLNAPDYTRTCLCAYQNQTSLALVHMPEVELWTYNSFSLAEEGSAAIRRLGVNLGAPGDRRSEDGVLWIEHPSVGGSSPKIQIEVEGQVSWFRHHSARVSGEGLAWVAASGADGVRKVSVRLAAKKKASAPQESPHMIPIAQGSDDAEESAAGKVGLASSDLELTEEKSQQTVGLRFQKVPIGPGDRIRRACVQFQVDEGAAFPTKLSIHGQAADNAPTFAAKPQDISSRERTKAVVSWEPKPWKAGATAGPDQQTPDLTPVLREIVARPGWKEGNAVVLIVEGTGKRVARAFENKKFGPASLVLELDKGDESGQRTAAEDKSMSRNYTVHLHFVEPDRAVEPSQRVFRVRLQDRTVVERLDPVAEARGPLRSIVKRFSAVPIADMLCVELQPLTDREPVLCGIELWAEDSPAKRQE